MNLLSCVTDFLHDGGGLVLERGHIGLGLGILGDPVDDEVDIFLVHQGRI